MKGVHDVVKCNSFRPPKGVHRVSKKLANGRVREYHYAFRNGPRFWDSSMKFNPGDPPYSIAYAEAVLSAAPKCAADDRNSTTAVLGRYRDSAHFLNLAERTRKDYTKYLSSFEAEFGEDPIKMFEEREAVAEIRDWKSRWALSPKQYDYATTVVTRFLNWAKSEDMAITTHYHFGVERVYRSDRSDIVWHPEELEALLAVADECERRVIVAASEGGLTPQDIGILKPEHVQRTTAGRRLFFRRTKSANPVSFPVTPALSSLIDTTPPGQKYFVVSRTGRALTPERASQIVREVKLRANARAERDSSKARIRDELRLYDMRGTAATELLRAGCSLNQIASSMGWGLRHAANIIEKYARVAPEVTDEVLEKLMIARRGADLK